VSRARHGEGLGAGILILPYLVVMLVAGVVPVIYAVQQSLLDENGQFNGVKSYDTVVHYYDFVNTFKHIGSVIIVWLPLMMIGVVAMAAARARDARATRRRHAFRLLPAGGSRRRRELHALCSFCSTPR